MRLYFARHGESEANVGRVIANRGWAYPLTDRGRRQAAELGDLLAAGLGDVLEIRIASSPLRRAVETAEIVQARIGGEIDVTRALREADCGVMEGRTDSVAWAAHDRVQAAWAAGHHGARLEGGESLDDLVSRFVPWLGSVVRGEAAAGAMIAIGQGSLYRCVLPRVVVDRDGRAIVQPEIGQACALVVEMSGDGRLVETGRLALGPR